MIGKTTTDNLRRAIMVPAALALVFLIGGAIWGVTVLTHKDIEHEFAGKTERFGAQWQQGLAYEQATLELSLERVEYDAGVRQAWLDQDRDLLLKRAAPFLEHFQTDHKITHIYFVEVDRTCFLRVHNPVRRGDTISRYTMMQAVATGSEVCGVELGMLGAFTLRLVKPWYIDGQLVGYLEMGKEIQQVTGGVEQALGVKITTLLNKSLVTRSNWLAGQKIFHYTGRWDEFTDHVIVEGSTDDLSPELCRAIASHQYDLSSGGQVQYSHNDRVIRFDVLPMLDFAGNEVGHYILQWDVTQTIANRHNSIIGIVSMIVLLGGFLMWFFWNHLGLVQAGMKENQAQLRLAKDRAVRSDKAKSEFLANMSHEIRTPMNGVVGMVDLLLESDLSPSQVEQATLAQSSATSLLRVINDILDFSKVEAGKLVLEHFPFDVYAEAAAFADIQSANAVAAGLSFTKEIDPQVPQWVKGDSFRLRQILTNLVSNALKFTEQGEVNLRLEVQDQGEAAPLLRFSVQDNGIGIAPDRQVHLFEAFTQADGSTTRNYGGTGLGLTICHQLVSLMKGQIGVNSTPGHGSEFWFTIPLEKVPESEIPSRALTSQKSPAPMVEGGTDKPHILLVEDNIVNRKMALGILKKVDVTVDTAVNGLEAVQALSEREYDLVLMDCQMPEMDGYQATGVIRSPSSQVLNHHVPIIAMTANAMAGDREKCLNAGMDDYLSKPVRPKVLRELLTKWLVGQPA